MYDEHFFGKYMFLYVLCLISKITTWNQDKIIKNLSSNQKISVAERQKISFLPKFDQ